MRKKLTLCLGLVLLALLVTGLVAWFLPPAEPPLRVGMTEEEVDEVMEKSGYFQADVWGTTYDTLETDRLGYCQSVVVTYDKDGQLKQWRVDSVNHVQSPLLDRAMKWVGW